MHEQSSQVSIRFTKEEDDGITAGLLGSDVYDRLGHTSHQTIGEIFP